MQHVVLPDGTTVPALGQGTWRLGERPDRAGVEAEAILAGIDAGMALIDTAEMYGDGATERFLGKTLVGRRHDVFLVSKAYPRNASRARLAKACEASLKRLGTDYLDLYLLHWPGDVPLAETVEAMTALRKAGKIKAWGVSNFDVDDMRSLMAAGGEDCATNQILYNLTRRGPEFDLIPWMHDRAMPVMAYSPIDQGRLPKSSALDEVAALLHGTPMQVALAWSLRLGAISIPKASTLAHVRQNRAAADLTLGAEALSILDQDFPAPLRKQHLAML